MRVTAKNNQSGGQFHTSRRFMAVLLTGTILVSMAVPAAAQTAPAPAPAPAAQDPAAQTVPSLVTTQQVGTIRSVVVVGNQRLEPDTVLSYIHLRPGQPYTRASLDEALKDLYATELFADAQITDNQGALVIQVKENPVINRVILEGNKRLKEDKIRPEIKMQARQIYTRSKVRADVARILELYKRQGRYAASVEPKMVQLDQNRVDIVFEINEGPKSKVRQINIIGNTQFSDGELRGEMATKQAGLTTILSGNTSYDPDRMAYDQQKLRQFYLTEGYADFRVVSAVAELTSDKQDFIITYVVEEGERYKFGDVKVESELRDFRPEMLQATLPMKQGDWYNAKLVEDTVDRLTETAGMFGYAFADINPQFSRDKDAKTMGILFKVGESPRVYVERIDVNGNTLTQDKVVRREFRLNEGDAFNTFAVKRSENRINSLGYFQENLKIEQKPGSAPDRIILEANVEEKSTGELQLSAGFSSLESFILNGSIRQRNFRGKGQQLGASVNWSSYSKSAELSFTEPYLFDRNIALSGSIYRRDLNSFNFINSNERKTTFEQSTTGASIRIGVPLTEYMTMQGRYTFNLDKVSLDKDIYYFGGQCDPYVAGRYLCDAIGKRTTSLLGYTIAYDRRDNSLRPTRGHSIALSQDFAGLGGDVRYLRTSLNADKYWNLGKGFIFSVQAQGGYIHPFEKSRGQGIDEIRLNDRFFLGEPQMRGFDIRGIGPRVLKYYAAASPDAAIDITDPLNPVYNLNRKGAVDDALGGRAFYMGRAELEIPLGSSGKSMGLRPSVFVDVGSVWSVKRPILTTLDYFTDNEVGKHGNGLGDGKVKSLCRNASTSAVQFMGEVTIPGQDGNPPTTVVGCDAANGFVPLNPFEERFYGSSAKPRVSVGVGVNWNSPFGPFRIDIARALVKEPGDDTKLFTFNVGTQF